MVGRIIRNRKNHPDRAISRARPDGDLATRRAPPIRRSRIETARSAGSGRDLSMVGIYLWRGHSLPVLPDDHLFVDPARAGEDADELAREELLELGQGVGAHDGHRALDGALPEGREERRGAPRPVRVVAAVLGHEESGQAPLVPGLGERPAEVRARPAVEGLRVEVRQGDRHAGPTIARFGPAGAGITTSGTAASGPPGGG